MTALLADLFQCMLCAASLRIQMVSRHVVPFTCYKCCWVVLMFPGGHLAKPPFPKHVCPPNKPAKPKAPDEPLDTPPLGFPTCPEDLVIDDDGNPLRIDKAYSWEAPIANHGLMHMVITNAVNGDPYPIDTLIFFMANMSWNSSMNTGKIRELLREKDENGEYKLPFLVVADAFHSEMVAFADLVLPDTTYLERYDTISMLDRPISET